MQTYHGSYNISHVRSSAGQSPVRTGSSAVEHRAPGVQGILHKVQQGEHLSRIAQRYGVADYRRIWEHPCNAALCQKRGNPNVLFPGDIVYIPGTAERQEQRATGKQHAFQVSRPTLLLRIVHQDVNRRPLGNFDCMLRVTEGAYRITTDPTGQMEKSISLEAEKAVLTVQRERMIDIDLRIGHLDPVTEPSGWWARLMNLGYYLGSADTLDKEALRSAVEEFQCDQEMTVDGVCGPETQDKLKQVHGC